MPTLPGDRPLIVTGKVAGAAGDEVTSELAWSAKPIGTAPTQTSLLLRASSPLKHTYERGTVTIAANVAFASHGETRSEILGSGDASTPFQRFALKSSPLTYVPSDDAPGGAVTTLTVRVNDLAWHEYRDLYGPGGRDRAYAVRIDDDGVAKVEFGDGVTGARLPSGIENVRARYRVGTGLAGQVKPGQLTLLTNPPLGVKRVTNPFAASGASDPEAGDAARSHAPLTVRTLDRTVSLDDFEDFAATFAGIGKAQAAWLWSGEERLIVLTLADASGAPLDTASVAFDHLAKALVSAGEPRRHVQLVPYVPRPFQVVARLVLAPDFSASAVVTQAAATLADSLAFEQRAFAQPVAQSEIESTLQAVAGVVAVDLTQLHLAGGTGVSPLLQASGATVAGSVLTGAELLQLAPDGITVTS
jgi:predicted phage baseplate assembly protein